MKRKLELESVLREAQAQQRALKAQCERMLTHAHQALIASEGSERHRPC